MNNYNNYYLKNRKMPKWLLNISKHYNFKILAVSVSFFACCII